MKINFNKNRHTQLIAERKRKKKKQIITGCLIAFFSLWRVYAWAFHLTCSWKIKLKLKVSQLTFSFNAITAAKENNCYALKSSRNCEWLVPLLIPPTFRYVNDWHTHIIYKSCDVGRKKEVEAEKAALKQHSWTYTRKWEVRLFPPITSCVWSNVFFFFTNSISLLSPDADFFLSELVIINNVFC